MLILILIITVLRKNSKKAEKEKIVGFAVIIFIIILSLNWLAKSESRGWQKAPSRLRVWFGHSDMQSCVTLKGEQQVNVIGTTEARVACSIVFTRPLKRVRNFKLLLITRERFGLAT